MANALEAAHYHSLPKIHDSDDLEARRTYDIIVLFIFWSRSFVLWLLLYLFYLSYGPC